MRGRFPQLEKLSGFLSRVSANKAFLKHRERKWSRGGSSEKQQNKKNKTWSCSGFPTPCQCCGLLQPYLLAQKTWHSHLSVLLVSGSSYLKELDWKLNTVIVSILLLGSGVLLTWWNQTASRLQHTEWFITRLSIKADAAQPGFMLPVWSPHSLPQNTVNLCFHGRCETLFCRIHANVECEHLWLI